MHPAKLQNSSLVQDLSVNGAIISLTTCLCGPSRCVAYTSPFYFFLDIMYGLCKTNQMHMNYSLLTVRTGMAGMLSFRTLLVSNFPIRYILYVCLTVRVGKCISSSEQY
jgi:hypothetical protein